MSDKTKEVSALSRKAGELEAIDKSSKYIHENFGAKAASDYLTFMGYQNG